MAQTRICDVCIGSIGRKGKAYQTQQVSNRVTYTLAVLLTVRGYKAISNYSQCPGLQVETVNLVLQARLGPEMLPVAVLGVGEVNVAISRVDGDIVEGVELSTEKVVDEG